MKSGWAAGKPTQRERRTDFVGARLGFCFAVVLSFLILEARLMPGLSPIPRQGSLGEYVRSNSQFGAKLFRELIAADPTKNAVCSPLAAFAPFAYLRGHVSEDVRAEMHQVFDWAWSTELAPPHRFLMARFEIPPPPPPESERRKAARTRYRKHLAALPKELRKLENFESFYQNSAMMEDWGREEFWLSLSLFHHSPQFTEALSSWEVGWAKRSYGLEIKELKNDDEWAAVLSEFPGFSPLEDHGESDRLFVMNSILHLGTKWEGNTFRLNKPKPGLFFANPESPIPATMLVSEYSNYPYVKTDRYEAVVLPAENADFMAILPAEGGGLDAIVDELAINPEIIISQLERRVGDVELPEFNFSNNQGLRRLLENLGLRGPFQRRANLFSINGSRLLAVKQAVSIAVDRRGILANAKISLAGVLGGVMMPDEAFHMKVNRPFLFQIRDNVTGVLLFMGAVTDPSKH
jgi:serine protease inhibitor